MSIEKDLETIAEQERVLVFDRFGANEAWQVGSWLRARALQLDPNLNGGDGMTFEIWVAGRLLFASATDGAAAGQRDWIRRKRNVVERFGKSSYAVGLELVRIGQTIEQRHELTIADYATHGGGFPIVLRGTGLVGSVIASGLPQRDDHAMVVEGLAALLGVKVAELE